jgi:hypothetical protein
MRPCAMQNCAHSGVTKRTALLGASISRMLRILSWERVRTRSTVR